METLSSYFSLVKNASSELIYKKEKSTDLKVLSLGQAPTSELSALREQAVYFFQLKMDKKVSNST